MNTIATIRARRSIKRFSTRAVTREEIEQVLDAAVMAPNHRLTQPWRFYVLGPDARHAYGLVLGNRKAKKQTDAEKAAALRDTVAAEHRALPGMIAVAMVAAADVELAEENYAATMMAIHGMLLAAHELGLGAAIRTGAVMQDPAARAAVGVPEEERIVAIVNIGEPADVPAPPQRQPASSFTTWLP